MPAVTWYTRQHGNLEETSLVAALQRSTAKVHQLLVFKTISTAQRFSNWYRVGDDTFPQHCTDYVTQNQ